MCLRYSSPPEVDKCFDQLKRMLVGYLLAQRRAIDLRFTLRGTRQQSFHCFPNKSCDWRFSLDAAVSTLSQAKLLLCPETSKWRLASVRTDRFSIRAAVSIEPSPSKANQFISIGQVPLPRTRWASCLFETVNNLFETSSFGVARKEQDSTMTTSEAQKGQDKTAEVEKSGKGVDRWPMFYLRIDTKSDDLPRMVGQSDCSIELHAMIHHLTNALESLFSHFLHTYEFKCSPRHAETIAFKASNSSGEKVPNQKPVGHFAAERSQAVAEARYLRHWHRVKSGRQCDEDFRYGLCLTEANSDCRVQANIVSGQQLLIGDIGYGEMDLELVDGTLGLADAALNEKESKDEDKDVDTDLLSWTNPRNGQVIYLHPRTGVATPDIDKTTMRSTRVGKSPQRPPPGRIRRNFRTSAFKGDEERTVLSSLNLQKYNRLCSLSKLDNPINSIKLGEPSVVDGRQSSFESDVSANQGTRNVTKESLSLATVVRQLDQKFILACVPASRDGSKEPEQENLLVLIDQHAADERIRFERLCQDICKYDFTRLTTPLVFEITEPEAELFQKQRTYFQKWCFDYKLHGDVGSASFSERRHKARGCTIEITTLPALIAERCRAEPKILSDLLRKEVWSDRWKSECIASTGRDKDSTRAATSWLSEIPHCPAGMLEMLKSRSCRTAIMFNDQLSRDKCSNLVRRLSHCAFPFQCAHGRPTLIVLAKLGGIDRSVAAVSVESVPGSANGEVGFDTAWKRWTGSE